MNRLIYLLAVIALSTLLSSPATAQDAEDYHPLLSSKFSLALGVFWPNVNYSLEVDGKGADEEIDFGEALKLDEYEATFAGNFRWRFTDKWSFWGQYWDTSTKGGGVLTEDVEWGDVVFKEGTFANSGIDLKVARAFFGRTFTNSPKYEFGLGLGLHWMELGSFLEGEIITEDDRVEFDRVSVSADFPMPNIGGWYMYSWSPKWVFEARVDWLSASIGDYSGSLWDASAGVNYMAFKNIGIGIHYQAYRIDFKVDKSDWHGKVKMDQVGPMLTLTASW